MQKTFIFIGLSIVCFWSFSVSFINRVKFFFNTHHDRLLYSCSFLNSFTVEFEDFFADKVKEFMQQKGISFEEAAKRADIDIALLKMTLRAPENFTWGKQNLFARTFSPVGRAQTAQAAERP